MPRSSRLALLLPALLAACQAPPPAAPPAPVRLEHRASELAIARLPASLRAAEGADLALVPVAPDRPGRLLVAVGAPEPGGVNLVETMKAAAADLAARPGGEFLGQREMVAPSGPAFSARGRYPEGGGQIEELRVFTLHPDRRVDRLVTLTYRYPAGDREESGARFNEALLVLGELEALASPGS